MQKNKTALDPLAFRTVMGCFATGVAVITAHDADLGPVGLTINSLTSVSLTPPLLLFCLDKKAALHATLRRADGFTINLLAEDQQDVSRHFASRHHHMPERTLWDPAAPDEHPRLRGSLGWLLCRRVALHQGGDHTIFIGEVMDLHKRRGDKNPLAYYQGRYRALPPAETAPAGKVTSGARK